MLKRPNMDKMMFEIFPLAKKRILACKCATCGKPVKEEDFRDKASIREYGISGTCQTCQDEMFGEE